MDHVIRLENIYKRGKYPKITSHISFFRLIEDIQDHLEILYDEKPKQLSAARQIAQFHQELPLGQEIPCPNLINLVKFL